MSPSNIFFEQSEIHHWLSNNKQNFLWYYVNDHSETINNIKKLELAEPVLVVKSRKTQESYSSYIKAINQLSKINKNTNQPNLKNYSEISSLLNSKKYALPKKISDKGQRIYQAVTRRISRESNHNAKFIDEAARYFIDLAQSKVAKKKELLVILQNFESMDRPSIRVFYRAIKLLDKSFNIKWIFLLHFEDKKFEKNYFDLVLKTRLQFLNRFKKLLRPHEIKLRDSYVQNQHIFSIPKIQLDDVFLDIAKSLVEQNYERAMLVSISKIYKTSSSELKSKLKRLLAIACVNAGLNEESLKILSDALKESKKPEKRAHLHYLRGLVYNKRLYDLERAQNEYDLGIMETRNGKSQQMNLEKAWLINGKSFVNALRAKKLSSFESVILLKKTLQDEMRAYRLVEGSAANDFVYLRFNLITNVALLLEILEEYNQAINFWNQTYVPYAKETGNAEFDKVLGYRMGLLLWKAGHLKEAKTALRGAANSAIHLEDYFEAEKILYALGYISLVEDHKEDAVEAFKKGLHMACNCRELESIYHHSIGLLLYDIDVEDLEEMKLLKNSHDPNAIEIFNKILEMKNRLKENQFSKQFHFELTPPSPKLPSYVASIDLEPIPNKDMNRVLTSSESERFVLKATE